MKWELLFIVYQIRSTGGIIHPTMPRTPGVYNPPFLPHSFVTVRLEYRGATSDPARRATCVAPSPQKKRETDIDVWAQVSPPFDPASVGENNRCGVPSRRALYSAAREGALTSGEAEATRPQHLPAKLGAGEEPSARVCPLVPGKRDECVSFLSPLK